MFINVNEMKSKVEVLYKSGELDRLEAFGDTMQDKFDELGKDYTAQFRLLSQHPEDTNKLLQYETIIQFTEKIGFIGISTEEIIRQIKNYSNGYAWSITSHIIHLMIGRHIPFTQICELLLPVVDTIKPVEDNTLLEDLNEMQCAFSEKQQVILLTEIDEEGMELVRKELQKYL